MLYSFRGSYNPLTPPLVAPLLHNNILFKPYLLVNIIAYEYDNNRINNLIIKT